MTEILDELKENIKKQQALIDKQIFSVGDARAFLNRTTNYFLSMEDLIKSRDNWKRKFIEMKGGKK